MVVCAPVLLTNELDPIANEASPFACWIGLIYSHVIEKNFVGWRAHFGDLCPLKEISI